MFTPGSILVPVCVCVCREIVHLLRVHGRGCVQLASAHVEIAMWTVYFRCAGSSARVEERDGRPITAAAAAEARFHDNGDGDDGQN